MFMSRKWAAVGFSDTSETRRISGGLKSRFLWLCPTLKVLGLALLVVCMARPQSGIERTKIFTEGIAIEMVLDRSGSMEALDFTLNNQRVNRLAAIKNVATRFILGEVLLLIGPEGGWSEAELEAATRAGARRVRFADQILRTETAAIQLAGLCVWARSLAGK